METIYVTTHEQLESCVLALEQVQTYLAIDTEFRRESTYFPELSLVQIATDNQVFLVDAVAIDSLEPLFHFLETSAIPKVLHSGRQDLEIFCNLMHGAVLNNVFDTQIAAMFLGYGESAGFEALVHKVLSKELDKTSRNTDWMRRPLSAEQQIYAANDVIYLRPLYEALIKRLEDKGRLSWMPTEMQPLMRREFLITDPESAWLRFNVHSQVSRYIVVLQHLAKWREIMAQQTNVPRSWVLKDEVVLRLASRRPTTLQGIESIVGSDVTAVSGADLLEVLTQACAQEISAIGVEHDAVLNKHQHAVLDILKVVLRIVCEQVGLNAKMLASKEDLLGFIKSSSSDAFGPELGWRYEVFWSKAKSLMAGDLCIQVHKGKAVLAKKTANTDKL